MSSFSKVIVIEALVVLAMTGAILLGLETAGDKGALIGLGISGVAGLFVGGLAIAQVTDPTSTTSRLVKKIPRSC